MGPAPRNDAFARAMLLVCVAAPGLFAAAHAPGLADAAHDEGVIRALGLGWTGVFRALDAVVAAPFVLLPVGTRALRAALASSALAGVVGGVAFAMARAFLAACAPPTRLGLALAAVGVTTATMGVAFQLEAVGVGGAMLGVVLALAPLAVAMADRRFAATRAPLFALLVVLAATYEPLVGLVALAGLVGFAALAPRPTLARLRPFAVRAAACAALGLVPLVVALARRRLAGGEVLGVPALAAWAGERGASPSPAAGAAHAFLLDELGAVMTILAAGAVVVSALLPRARAPLVGLLATAAAGVAAASLGAPVGPSRYGAPLLAALVAVAVLAAAGMQSLVRAIATTRVPFADVSATMVVLLLVAVPIRTADDAAVRLDGRAAGAPALWDEVAFGPLPPDAVVLVQQPVIMARVLASRAAGGFRGDLAVVPTFDLGGPLAMRELSREPKLTPFVRDMALTGLPEEWSLSSVAASRPLVLTYDPRWDRPLARHLVPAGLFARYEPEPRATSDRRIALDAQGDLHARLVRGITRPASPLPVQAPREAELPRATALLLRARLVALAASHDRELLPRAAEDLRPFSPDDAVSAEVLRRASVTRGAVDVKDIVP